MWHTGSGIAAGRSFVMVGCFFYGRVGWLSHCVGAFPPSFFLRNAMSSLVHQSIGETALLHQATPHPLYPANTVRAWTRLQRLFVSRQKSSDQVPDTWSGTRQWWFIHAINSCTNSRGANEDDDRLFNKFNQHMMRIKIPFYIPDVSICLTFSLFLCLIDYFLLTVFHLPVLLADANCGQSFYFLGPNRSDRMAASEIKPAAV